MNVTFFLFSERNLCHLLLRIQRGDDEATTVVVQ